MIELYHHGSSVCAAKVRFALAEKHLDWNSHYIDILKGEQFDESYLKLNPKGVVPTLIHDQRIIPESTVICEYAEETFPEHPIFPSSPFARALVRVWTKAVDEELHPACSAMTYIVSHRHTILRSGVSSFEAFLERGASEGYTSRALKWQWIQLGIEAPGAREKIAVYDSYLHKMEGCLTRSNWLVGSAFSMADIAMAPYVNRLAALHMEGFWTGGRLPHVEVWFDRVKARTTFKPAFIDWMPETLAREMRENGRQSWPEIKQHFSIA
jgi:glutathione S-transferase